VDSLSSLLAADGRGPTAAFFCTARSSPFPSRQHQCRGGSGREEARRPARHDCRRRNDLPAGSVGGGGRGSRGRQREGDRRVQWERRALLPGGGEGGGIQAVLKGAEIALIIGLIGRPAGRVAFPQGGRGAEEAGGGQQVGCWVLGVGCWVGGFGPNTE